MKNLVFYCSRTLCNCGLGGYFEREANSPKLLKTLKTESKEWSGWIDGTRLVGRRATRRFGLFDIFDVFNSFNAA